MEKAYDLKELGDMILAQAKVDGLAIAEQAAEKLGKAVYVGTKQWLKESATLSENKIDDIASPLYDFIDGLVLPQIEKIDFDGDGK